jgi:hypothetical protein
MQIESPTISGIDVDGSLENVLHNYLGNFDAHASSLGHFVSPSSISPPREQPAQLYKYKLLVTSRVRLARDL